MRLAADVEEDKPDSDAALARDAFAVLALDLALRRHPVYLCLVVGGGGGRNVLIVLVGNSHALKGGFEIGDVHCTAMLCRLTRGGSGMERQNAVDVLRLTG
jgi:hypothetical protein